MFFSESDLADPFVQSHCPVASITISIPAYNDAPTIASLVEQSAAVASQVTDDYEIFVIDDGSQDETGQILSRLEKTMPRLRVRRHDRNLGFGPTIREAFTLPQTDWVFFIPGDGQIPPSELLELFPHADRYDFVLGHRKYRRDSWSRKVQSWCYNILISLIARRRIRDVNSGGLLRCRALQDIRLRSNSGFIHAEILLELLRRGARVAEIEIRHMPRCFGEASGNKLRVILSTAGEMLLYVGRRLLGR